jgi:hypothetical protein
MVERIRGETGDRMVEAALRSMLRAWAGTATDIGLTQPRSYWRHNMRAALEAAFAELLKDPTP